MLLGAIGYAVVIVSSLSQTYSGSRPPDLGLLSSAVALTSHRGWVCQPRPDRAMTLVMLIRTAVKPSCTNDAAMSAAGWVG